MNALTLTLEYHQLFGAFEIYFEHTGNPHEYKIQSTEPDSFLSNPLLPITRTLTLSPDHTVDPPSQQLLAIHRAIAFIIKLSGVGRYLEDILDDLDEMNIREDGSTDLGPILELQLGGW